MTSPYFSIVIPTLNEEKYLPKLLGCLCKQTFKDFEVVVVDGHSDDQTQKKALEFTPKLPLQVIVSEKRNVSFQRNLGAKKASSKILVFFDADTQIPKNFLSKLHYAFVTKNPDLLTTWTKVDSHLERDKTFEILTNVIFETARFFGTAGLFGAMLAVKKSVFNKVKGFKVKMKFGEDTDLAQRIVRKGYKYIILRNTYYVFSLRRYEKEGFWKTIQKSTLLNLGNALKIKSILTKIDYPMGGQVFAKIPQSRFKTPKAKSFFKKLWEDLKET